MPDQGCKSRDHYSLATMATVTDSVARILAEHGPLHDDAIAALLRDNGEAVPEHVVDELIHPAGELVDGRWVWLPTLLAGRVFTHRLDIDELTHDLLTVTPDLDPITALCEHTPYQRLADGSPVQIVVEGYDDDLFEQRGIPLELLGEGGALLLAPGTLAALGVTEGDLVGIRLTEQGLALARVATREHADVAARLATKLTADEPVFVDSAVWTVCVEDSAAFTKALVPLSEIIDDAGLTRSGEYLATAGFDFDTWRFELDSTVLAQRHGLDPDDAFAVQTLIALFEQMQWMLDAAIADESPPTEGEITAADGEYAELMGDVGAVLADPLLADVLVAETVDAGRGGAAALGLLAETMEPKVPRAARVALRWLRAVALERIGDIEAAERELLAAESMDSEWAPALIDLARVASDRGDAERGLALLRRAGVEADDPLAVLLQRYRVAPRSDVGRNAPCWCGSGRKYKKCHLGDEQLPLYERAGWLYAKACEYVAHTGWDEALLGVAYERSRHAADVDADLVEAVSDPLVTDALLFEGGAFEEFLRVRGSLLPDDELELAQKWLRVDRSLFEVEQLRPGQGLTVRDVRTGDRHDVRERKTSAGLEVGQLICARVVPVGDTMQFFGGAEPVAPHERDPLIALLDSGPDEVTLVAQLSRRFAPPKETGTEGDVATGPIAPIHQR